MRKILNHPSESSRKSITFQSCHLWVQNGLASTWFPWSVDVKYIGRSVTLNQVTLQLSRTLDAADYIQAELRESDAALYKSDTKTLDIY